MSYPHYDLVTRAHSELLAEGLIGPRTDQAAVENDKGLICRRAAYHVYTERDPSHGLMEKTEGNNSMGYSVDWILRQTDGVGWDVTTDDGVNAFPVNGSEHPPDASYIPRWRQPTAALAQISDEPDPAPTPEPDTVTTDELMAQLMAMESRLAQQSDANTQRILDTIDSIKTQVEESLQKALALIVMHRRREDEPDETEGVV